MYNKFEKPNAVWEMPGNVRKAWVEKIRKETHPETYLRISPGAKLDMGP